MKTLLDLANKYGAKIHPSLEARVIDRLGVEQVEGTMYFSGWVVRHIDVIDDQGGLNNSGVWPHYLVNDNDTFKIISA